MRRSLRMAFLLMGVSLLGGLTGCQSGASPQRRIAAKPEPGLTSVDDPGAGSLVAKATPPPQETFVDRHPLFSKPRDYYESSGNNTLVKVAGATIVGVPVGIFGELRQIVVGSPPAPRGF
jgi:hypothetical protein